MPSHNPKYLKCVENLLLVFQLEEAREQFGLHQQHECGYGKGSSCDRLPPVGGCMPRKWKG